MRDKEQIEKEAMELVRQREMAQASCRELADDMRLIDQHKMKDSLSPEAREVCRRN